MNLFTPEDMLRYLYNEMPAEERIAFVQAMDNDWTLREETERFQQTLSSLDTLHYTPRPKAVQSILQYAEATRPVEH